MPCEILTAVLTIIQPVSGASAPPDGLHLQYRGSANHLRCTNDCVISAALTAEGLKHGLRLARVKAGYLRSTSISAAQLRLQLDAQRLAMDAAFAEKTPEITPGRRTKKSCST